MNKTSERLSGFRQNINQSRLNTVEFHSIRPARRIYLTVERRIVLSTIRGEGGGEAFFPVKYRLSFGVLFTQARSVEIFDRPQSGPCICIGSRRRDGLRENERTVERNGRRNYSRGIRQGSSESGLVAKRKREREKERERGGREQRIVRIQQRIPFLSFLGSSNECAPSFNFPRRKTRIQPSSFHRTRLASINYSRSRFTARKISYRNIRTRSLSYLAIRRMAD